MADVILIGAGIMSATLGVLLKELEPDITIDIFEQLDGVAEESSDAWNNAGTGHSAYCELNYTPLKADGSVDIFKAIKIAESFEVSRQFWSHLVQHHVIRDPTSFITAVPHLSFVKGQENVDYLRKRFEAMRQHHFFKDMVYSEDFAELSKWVPLVTEGRDAKETIAATCMGAGTDINFGALTRSLFGYLVRQRGVRLHLNTKVKDIERGKKGKWIIEAKPRGRKARRYKAKFLFIGGGGMSLPLLEKCDIPESKGYGGFPVSGQWLICTEPAVVKKHHTKVYGKASVGAPPMSVPHLDTRMIQGRRHLLFGPFAGFSTKFLKHGSALDLLRSIKTSNIWPMMEAGAKNLSLVKYLINQVMQTPGDRIEALREFVPHAHKSDWKLVTAGQRVQVIKKDPEEGGILEFGTELVTSADGTVAALLGASPGASTAVAIMLDLLHQCFRGMEATDEWQGKLRMMIPSFGRSLADDEKLFEEVRQRTTEVLRLR